MELDRKQFLKAVRSLLSYHVTLGIEDYPGNEALERFLQPRMPEALKEVVKRAGPDPERRPEPVSAAAAATSSKKAADEMSLLNIEDIHAEVASCAACDLHKHRIYPVAGRGGKNGPVRLMVIGDWLTTMGQESLQPDLLLGREQDLMLSRMLKAISLSIEKVYITNIIKCAIPRTVQPQAAHVDSCISFIRRQIALLEPEVICTMGPVTARALLEKKQPLSSIRGKFHDYRISDNRVIPVLPTYHPSFLLQNPEMKKATWLDLQLLAKKLGLPLAA